MKFKVKRNDLLTELSYITPVVEKSSKMPILTHVLLDPRQEDNQLVMAGSDLTVSIRSSCPAMVEEGGPLALPARELTDIVRFIPESAEICLQSEGSERVYITFGRSKTRIVCLPADNFPLISDFSGAYLSVPGDVLRAMIQMTIFSTTHEQSRFSLNGVLLVINRNFIKMVSTDGHRMAYAEAPKVFEELEAEFKILIPKKTVAELSRMLQKDHLFVQFAHDSNHLYFKVDNRLLVSGLLAGQFPNYEMVLPRNLYHRVQLKTVELKNVVHRLNVMADEVSKRIIFRLEAEKIFLRSEDVRKGEAEEEIYSTYAGDKVEFAFNSQYLLEFLNVVESPEVVFEFSDENTAGLFRVSGGLDITYKYVVMPMSI